MNRHRRWHVHAQGRPPPLFVYRRESGTFWYNGALSPGPGAAQGYRFAGWLLAQSLANRAPLGCQLAPLLLQKLLLGDLFRVRRSDAGAVSCVLMICGGAVPSMQPVTSNAGCVSCPRSANSPLPCSPSTALTPSPPCAPRSPAWRCWRRSTPRPPRPWRGWRACPRSSTCSCWSWRAPPAAAPGRSGWRQRQLSAWLAVHACRASCLQQVPWAAGMLAQAVLMTVPASCSIPGTPLIFGCLAVARRYVALALRRLLVERVAWQADALAAGFYGVVAPEELRR